MLARKRYKHRRAAHKAIPSKRNQSEPRNKHNKALYDDQSQNKRFSQPTPFSRTYLKATVSKIRIKGDLLKLMGENKAMANLVASNGKIEPNNQVLGFIPNWRATQDKAEYWNISLQIEDSGAKKPHQI